MARPPAKALRIGIVRRGKIVEERLVLGRAPVTIGSGPRHREHGRPIVHPHLHAASRDFDTVPSLHPGMA